MIALDFILAGLAVLSVLAVLCAIFDDPAVF